MQKHAELTLRRIQLFASERGLGGKLYTDKAPVSLSVYHAPDRIPFEQAMQGEYHPTQVAERFGPFWSTHWFRVEINVPQAWAGQEVHFLWDSSSEATVWQDGSPVQGMAGTGGAWMSGPVRSEFTLTQKAKGGETYTLYIEMAVNNLFGLGVNETPMRMAQVGVLRQAEIAVFDREAWDLLWDFKVVADMAEALGPNTPRGGQALFAANKMVNLIDLEDRSTWEKARTVAKLYLAAKTGEGQLNLSAIGHAHIDTAWLWPLAETRRKCTRTFSTAVRYMDEYPQYQFACSQAQQYEWIKEMHPDLYERIKEKIKAGRFIPTGGSWVEPDCNIPSGESLVRQFVYGQRFFRKEFGITCQEFWEPDVFGYSAALPQILRQVGMRHFLTIKLSWNQFNKLSSHSFYWEGLDGSQVLTHFPPADTYNSAANVKEVLFSQTNYKDLDRSQEAYLLFGWGDGGGGPTRDMLEQIKRMENVDGLPRVEMRSPHEFFTRLEENSEDLLTWVGELYFELHRGTYTTQARNKLYNRQSEFLLHDLEFVAAVAHTLEDADYPQADLDRMWKMVLTNQFHDIIPGSSIAEVYEDSNAHYQEVLATAATLRNQSMVTLLGKPEQDGKNVAALNTLGVDRTEVVVLPAGLEGIQTTAGGKSLGIASVPSYGYRVFSPDKNLDQMVRVEEVGETIVLENDLVRAVFRQDGALISLFDKRVKREGVEPGQAANRFVLFDDNPNSWDAWDVDIFHLEKPLPVAGAKNYKVVEEGPLRAAVVFEYDLTSSATVRQTVSLTAVSPRLDFDNEVAWHENHKILKVEFPLNLHTTQATYEIQFGNVQRPTHWNTSWDMARFEVVGHKWADVSEPDFGVALLNDSKYGHSVHDNILRLSLLRAPTAPDPQADQGQHVFRYALLPHTGIPQEAGVIEEGYRFNDPLQIFPTGRDPVEKSFFQVSSPALILDTVKKAEDSDDVIVRLYEARGSHGEAQLSSPLPIQSAARCNLLEDEEPDGETEWKGGSLSLKFRPFQIITLKLRMS